MVKNPSANAEDARDVDSVPGLGICPGVGNDNPLPCSCLGNPTVRVQSTGSEKSQKRLSD